MIDSTIKPYPIKPIAEMPVDDQLAAALLDSAAEYSPQLQGRRIWLACSGGRDSLALAALCVQLYRQAKLPFLPQLLHIDHGLQAHSHDWAQHVARWAQAQQLPCQILCVQVQGHDEQAARQARYQALLSYINQNDVLLLAHHADDQAETVLMRLIQGAGVKGLSGMQPWRVQANGARQNVLWRPWLTVRRQMISAYAKRLQLPYIDDPTNDSGDNVRSGLRRDVLPALAAYNSNVIDNIARSAQLLSDAQVTVSAQAAADQQQVTITSLDYPFIQRVLNIDKLQALPRYRQRQLLHYWLAQDEPLAPTKQLIDDVLNLSLHPDNNHQTQLYWQAYNRQYIIRRYRQQLYRFSQSWLDWLALPLDEHTISFFGKESINTGPINISLRINELYSWQLQIMSTFMTAVETLIANNEIDSNGAFILKVAPLGRQRRLQTKLATRAQAGKKLYQTLAIPVWLRDSLIVVSIIPATSQANSIDDEVALLLLSPFASWELKNDNCSTKKINDVLHDKIKNNLKLLKK